MDNTAKYGTTVVVVINTIFGMLGLAFLIGGFFVKMGSDTLDKLAHGLLEELADKMSPDSNIDIHDFKLSEFVGSAADAFIAIGFILLFLVVWAYFGTCCPSRCMLIIYAVILTLIILGQVVLVTLFTTKRQMFDDALKTPLKESLTDFYKGERSQDGVSIGWNAIMGLLNCCGVDGSDDFKSAVMWNSTYVYHVTETIELEAPILCCKNKTDVKCSMKKTNGAGDQYNEGCYAALWQLVEDNKSAAIGVGVAIFIFQLILWFLVVWIAKELGKSKRKVSPKNS